MSSFKKCTAIAVSLIMLLGIFPSIAFGEDDFSPDPEYKETKDENDYSYVVLSPEDDLENILKQPDGVGEETSLMSTTYTMAELKSKFPAGKYWNHADGSNNPDGYSSTPCTHHGSCGYYPDNCKCNSFSNAIQCHGFALKLGYDYYGSSPRNWTKLTNLNSLKAGDIVRYKNNGHSIWVTKVSGSTVTYADCNSDGHCKIRWDQTISKTTLNSTLSYVLSAPSEAVESKPSAPTITSATANSDSSITIKWGAVSGATKYRVDGRKAGDDYTTLTTSLTSTSYTQTGLVGGSTYYYRVYAINSAGTSQRSETYMAQTKPSAPTISSVKRDSDTQLTVSWGAVTGATKYKLEYRRGDESDYKTISSSLTGTSYTQTNLTSNSKYWYRVTAIRVADVGMDESKKSTTLSSSASGVVGNFTKISQPKCAIDNDNTDHAIIKWTKAYGGGNYAYDIYRKAPTDSDFVKLGRTTGVTYTDTGLTSGVVYAYKIVTINTDAESICTQTDVFYAASKVTESITLTPETSTSIRISWPTLSGGGVAKYNVRKWVNDAYVTIATVSNTYYIDSGLDSSQSYIYYVQYLDNDEYFITSSFEKKGNTSSIKNLGDDFVAYISYAANGMVVTQDLENDCNVSLRSVSNSANQLWRFVRQSDGTYKIISMANNKLLDVYGGGTENGVNVAAYDDNGGGSNQRWYVIENNGVYNIKPACSACMLDVAGGGTSIAEGTNIETWTANNTDAQAFYINVFSDGEAPTISNFDIKDVSSESFTIDCDLNDNFNVKEATIYMRGQGDWYSITVPASNGHFSYTVETAKYYGQGSYQVYIYVVDAFGNQNYAWSDVFNAIDYEQVVPGKTAIYNGHIYQWYYVPGVTWHGARLYAQRLGGYLAAISDEEENNFIANELTDNSDNWFFIGLNDVWDEGNYTWINGEGSEYRHWYSTEPNNLIEDEDGVIINQLGDWYDTDVWYAAENLGFIVEYEPILENEFEYNCNTYQTYSVSPSWDIAKDYCESLGGHLVTISDSNENDAISSNIRQDKYYFCGASDRENEGEWKWITGEAFEYTKWYDGEPSNYHEQDYLCILNGKWDDMGDYLWGDIKGFICEYDKKEVKGIKLNKNNIEMVVGAEYLLEESVYPEDAEAYGVTWSTSDASVATVTDGTVLAKAAGTATITVTTTNGTKAKCTVTVKEPAVETGVAKVGEVTARAGENVTVPITISENPGIAGFNFEIRFDNSVLTPVSIEKGEALASGTLTSNIQQGGDLSDYEVVTAFWSNPSNVTDNGTIINVTFKVSDSAEDGDYPVTITYNEGDVTNQNYDDVNLGVKSGKVTVESVIMGDVRNDGVVNTKDSVRLSQYLAKWDVSLSDYEKKAADVYSDGIINTKDSVKLGQYLAKWDVTLSTFAVTEPKITFEVGEVEAESGEYVDVPVLITENGGVAGFNVELDYDKSMLTPVSLTQGEALSVGSITSNIQQGGDMASYDTITAFWSNPSNVTATGTAFVVRFKVSENATGEIPVTISYTEGDICDQYYNDLEVTLKNGKVVVGKVEGAEELDYTVKSITGNSVNGKFYAEAEVTKNSSRDAKDTIVIAAYKDGVMIDFVYMRGNFAEGQTVTFGGRLTGTDGATIKAFVWDDIWSMKCLSNVIEK